MKVLLKTVRMGDKEPNPAQDESQSPANERALRGADAVIEETPKTTTRDTTGDDESSKDNRKRPIAVLEDDQGTRTDADAKKHATPAKSKQPRRKKPRDAPRRPLSAYNLYFREERATLIAKNDRGDPDKDFQENLDAVVAAGKKRDDPSAIFRTF